MEVKVGDKGRVMTRGHVLYGQDVEVVATYESNFGEKWVAVRLERPFSLGQSWRIEVHHIYVPDPNDK